jgi:Domain of unknown function (DUF4336)
MLREIDNNLWVAEQPFKYWGLEVGARMTVIRLKSELMIISPIKPDEQTIHQINQLAPVAYIIAPNLYHNLFLSDFQAIFPSSKLIIPKGLNIKLPNLTFAQLLNDNEGSIDLQVDYILIDGFKVLDISGAATLNEYVFFHRDSRTLILTDTAFHFDGSFTFKTQLIAKLLGIYGKLAPSFLEKLASKDKEKVKQSFEKVFEWDFDRVIMAHGSIVESGAKLKLKQGYQQFVAQAKKS